MMEHYTYPTCDRCKDTTLDRKWELCGRNLTEEINEKLGITLKEDVICQGIMIPCPCTDCVQGRKKPETGPTMADAANEVTKWMGGAMAGMVTIMGQRAALLELVEQPIVREREGSISSYCVAVSSRFDQLRQLAENIRKGEWKQ